MTTRLTSIISAAALTSMFDGPVARVADIGPVDGGSEDTSGGDEPFEEVEPGDEDPAPEDPVPVENLPPET